MTDDQEYLLERAGVREYEAGFSRKDANAMAADEFHKPRDGRWQAAVDFLNAVDDDHAERLRAAVRACNGDVDAMAALAGDDHKYFGLEGNR